jgi:hypothetical protein
VTARPLHAALALVVVLLPVACGGGDDDAEPAASDQSGETAPAGLIVLNTEGNNLNAYTTEPPFEKQTVIRNATDDAENGLDLNGQVCFLGDGSQRFVAGEDTGQPERPPGWGIFELEGARVGDLSAREVGRLLPTYQPTDDNPEMYGCGVLSDGRIVTSDLGNQAAGEPSGQLIVWFPPFDTEDVAYCKLDVALPAAGGIHVDADDRIYLATARPPDHGILRYRGPYPTGPDAAGGCGRTDATGAPLADAVDRTVFIPADEHAATPNALAPSPDGGLYVASAFTGTIVHYDRDGRYVDTVLAPPPGEAFGATPYSTGSPLGIAVGPDGTIFFADLGLGLSDDGIGPLPAAGSVRRLDPSRPGATPETMDGSLEFPDGIGLLTPGAPSG